jgi:Ca-activated chloride channel family protein
VSVFDSVLALVVILVVIGVVVWAVLGRRTRAERRRGAPAYRRRSPWLKRLPILLIVGSLLFLALAFTQFRFLQERSAVGTVMLVLDASESMNRTDVEPTRLAAAQEAARVFLDELPEELQVGLVSFAGDASLLVAPDQGRAAVVTAVSDLPVGEGTVIGDGLSTALEAVEADWEANGTGPAAVVLLSDGRDTGSAVPPEEAASRAAELGIPVHTVVLGSAAATGGGGEASSLLVDIASTTQGSTFTATTAGGLIDVYRTLQTQLSTELAISDYGAVFVGLSALFAIAATVAILFSLRSDY